MTEPRLSLLWRILLSTSVAITLLFATTGWMVQTYANNVSEQSLQQEVKISLEAYRALWAERARNLSSLSKVVSSTSDVRAAFQTRDSATIRDTAGQIWAGLSIRDSAFMVLDPVGNAIASLGGPTLHIPDAASLLERARQRFPEQCSGYVVWDDRIYYVVITPVYVEAHDGPALLNVLLVAMNVNDRAADAMKQATNGSDFALVMHGRVIASSLHIREIANLGPPRPLQGGFGRAKIQGADSLWFESELPGLLGLPAPELLVVRSFAGASHSFAQLRKNVALIWSIAMCVGIALTYWMAKRILRPIHALDRAAEQVMQLNYDYRVPVDGADEIGRLAATFNAMCESIKAARQELITRERIATVGRLAASIVHDLRNPLAAIYGGAEMLVDSQLSEEQQKRLIANIYRSSRHIQRLLQELLEVTRVSEKPAETCRLAELVERAADSVGRIAQAQSVDLHCKVDPAAEILCDPDRLARVFVNIMSNSLDAMPQGGALTVTTTQEARSIVVHIEDTGAGISQEIWPRLFLPFASYGKKNGLGLGLALSRQTIHEHKGELWADRDTPCGARFNIRLPLHQSGTTAKADLAEGAIEAKSTRTELAD